MYVNMYVPVVCLTLTVDEKGTGDASWTQGHLYHGPHTTGQVCYTLLRSKIPTGKMTFNCL